MAYNITLEGKNKIIAERMLKEVATILEDCNIEYWLEGGTLLGIRRENRLLPWDNDIDISLNSNQLPKLKSFLLSLKKSNYRIKLRHFSSSSHFFEKNGLRMIKIREKHFFGLIKGSVCLDVFIKYKTDDKSYWEIANKTKCVPSKFYKTFKKIPFMGYDYSVPELTDEYLSYRYGDWQKTIKDWDTANDDKAIA